MNWGNAFWWFTYCLIAVFLQTRVPGVDFLLPGLIIAIQERNGFQLAWIFGIFLVLQEGMGSMAFGGILLWYGLTILLFFLGYILFEVESFLFIFLLCGCLAVTHVGVFFLMAKLQNVPVNSSLLMEESIVQALITPLLWRVFYPLRKLVRHENPA